MFGTIKNYFNPPEPSALEIVRKDHDDCARDLLKAQKEAEYWSAMVPMLQKRLLRLREQEMTQLTQMEVQ